MRVTEKWREAVAKGLMPENVVKALDSKSVEVERGGAETRKAAFVISTGDEDRDGDVVNPSGWKLDAYRKNPIVLWAHDVKAPPIARCEVIAVKNGKLRAETVFPDKGVYPFADTVCGLVKGGFLSGTSVGFHPLEAKPRGKSKGVQFDLMELYEFSILPVPSNREALVEAKAAGHDIAPVVKWAEEFLDRAQATGLWVPRYQIEKALKAVLPITVTVPAMPSDRQDVESGGHAIAGAALPDEFKEIVDMIEKHADHDQSTHNPHHGGGGGGKEGKDDGGERPALRSSTGARAFDFVGGERRARSMTDEQLDAARTDARGAMEAQRGMASTLDGKDEGYYTDEAATYAKEQARRAAGGKRDIPMSEHPAGGQPTKYHPRDLAHLITAQDRKDSGKRGYNPYALPQMFDAANRVEDAVRGGLDPSRAFAEEFNPTRSNHGIARKLGLHLDVERGQWIVKPEAGPLAKKKKEADMDVVLKALADDLFGETKAPADDDDNYAPEGAPLRGPAASAPDEGESDGADPAKGNAKNDEEQAGATPGGDPTEADPQLGGMLDQLAQGLLAEIEPLKQGGDPTQIATALKTALEKFAASFMQTYAGAPAPQQAVPGGPPAAAKPPAAAPPQAPPAQAPANAPPGAPPQAAPQGAPPAPPKKDGKGKPPWMKAASGDDEIVKALASVDEDELRGIVQRATKKNIEDARRHLIGRLPD